MNDDCELKMYIVNNFELNKQFVAEIKYKEKTLSKFDIDKNTIDLSVLNPFIYKPIEVHYLDLKSKTEKVKMQIISMLSKDEKLGIIVHLEDLDEILD